jgi:hypothetical protein
MTLSLEYQDGPQVIRDEGLEALSFVEDDETN